MSLLLEFMALVRVQAHLSLRQLLHGRCKRGKDLPLLNTSRGIVKIDHSALRTAQQNRDLTQF